MYEHRESILITLPSEVIDIIFGFLSISDILHLSETCRYLYDYTHEPIFRKQYLLKGPIPVTEIRQGEKQPVPQRLPESWTYDLAKDDCLWGKRYIQRLWDSFPRLREQGDKMIEAFQFHLSRWICELPLLVERILRAGPKPGSFRQHHFRSLEKCLFRVACKAGSAPTVRLFLNRPLMCDLEEEFNGFLAACEGNHAEVVDMMIKMRHVDGWLGKNIAIRNASEFGCVDVVELLLDHPMVDPAAEDNHAIRLASENGHAGVVRLLLKDSRVNPAARENYAIRFASRNGHVGVVDALLQDPRVNPAQGDNYALRLARRRGHKEVTHLLQQDPRVLHPSVIKKAATGLIRSSSRAVSIVRRMSGTLPD